jgi:hypothetical protein
MRKTWIILLIMAPCLIAHAAANNSLNGSAARLPFFAVIDGNANPPFTLANHETGSGRAIHLGVITWLSDETVRFLSCSPSAAPGSAI